MLTARIAATYRAAMLKRSFMPTVVVNVSTTIITRFVHKGQP